MYEIAGVTPPRRRIWSFGSVPEDCDELVVYVSAITPDESEPNCDTSMRMTVVVSATRCVPVAANKKGDRPPTPKQYADSGTVLGKDAWVLAKSTACLDLYGMGNLDAVVTVDEAQGGMQSVSLTFSLVI